MGEILGAGGVGAGTGSEGAAGTELVVIGFVPLISVPQDVWQHWRW